VAIGTAILDQLVDVTRLAARAAWQSPPSLGKHVAAVVLWTAALVMLAGCSTGSEAIDAGAQRRDAVLLWHNLPEPEAAAFEAVIDRYRRANPGVDIVLQVQDAEMDEAFVRATRSGLGPNLLLTNSASVGMLAESGAILPLDDRVTADDLARYLSVALRSLHYRDALFGLPMAVDTQVLYFNRVLTEQPPTTVDQLLEEASGGRRILMNSQFIDAVWSARTFGVELFDAEGNPQDTTAGVANWLIWTEQARDIPAFIMDDNTESLRRRFLEGDIPYYIGRAHELNLLGAALGSDLGVAPLPAGPAGSAGPPLTTTAFMVNAMSSEGQVARALDLVRFVTSSEQQSALMRDANLPPANGRVRISEGLYPRIAAVSAQALTAIPFPNDQRPQEAYAVLASAYNQTLAGVASATTAAAAVQATLIEDFGFPSGHYALGACAEQGQLTIFAFASSEQLAMLRTLANGFASVCPDITLNLRGILVTELDALSTGDVDLSAADLFFLSHQYLPAMLDAQAVRPLADLIDPVLVQQMRPIAVDAMSADGSLYGVPVVADLQILFQNQALARDAAGTLAELRAQAQAGVPVLLDGSFGWAFWGVGAFGGRLFGDDGQFVLSPTALTAWLAWLQESQQRFGIRTTPARSESRQLFLDRRSAYYVAASVDYADLAARIGDEDLGVILMPLGPAGPGRPFATFDGLMASDELTEQQATLAARFLNYAASVPAQDDLLRQLGVLPANSAVLIGAYPNTTLMAVQLQSATLLQNEPWVETVFALGDIAYRQVLQEGVAPAEAVRQMYEALEAEASRYGITIPAPDPPPLTTPVAPSVEPTAPPQEEGASPSPAAATPTPGASP
jgi:ABC-type glycerol-3-phosphate transport system substrate-binding protein